MNIELSDSEFKLFVTGLDSYIKLICQQIANNPKSGEVLQQLLPNLTDINNMFVKLQLIVNSSNKEVS